ncbi:PKD domain-containing protein [Methanogenium organophilum]|uniref:PKD domain-containing protein n=1 Tax=Methanogenium organophilum TaxID=2199 RepID=UPI0038993FBA
MSTDQNPIHTYTDESTYTVSLTSTNDAGSDTETKLGYVIATVPPLEANFNVNITGGKAPLTVQFTDTSTGAPDTWNWTFGDVALTNKTRYMSILPMASIQSPLR